MALTKKYLVSQKNIPLVFEKIIDGAVPEKFTLSHLQNLGFSSSNDRGFLALLKELKFLTDDGTPTQRYKDYRDRSRSKTVLGEALREAYGDLFLINDKNLSSSDRDAITGRFKSTHGSTDDVARFQAATFLGLLGLADTSAPRDLVPVIGNEQDRVKKEEKEEPKRQQRAIDLRYTIEVHLPPTKDVEVYNAIFRSLRQNLLDE